MNISEKLKNDEQNQFKSGNTARSNSFLMIIYITINRYKRVSITHVVN